MQSMSRGAAAFFGSALFVPVVGVLVFLFASSPCGGIGGELGATCVGNQTLGKWLAGWGIAGVVIGGILAALLETVGRRGSEA